MKADEVRDTPPELDGPLEIQLLDGAESRGGIVEAPGKPG
jgi:hypothetical protein